MPPAFVLSQDQTLKLDDKYSDKSKYLFKPVKHVLLLLSFKDYYHKGNNPEINCDSFKNLEIHVRQDIISLRTTLNAPTPANPFFILTLSNQLAQTQNA